MNFTMRRNRAIIGITLVELSIVIALMLILFSITAPSLRNIAPSSRLKSAAQAVRSLLVYARDVALTENTTYLVVFDTDRNRYWLSSSENFDTTDPISSLDTELLEEQSSQNEESEEEEEEEATGIGRTSNILGIPRKLPSGITFSSLSIGDEDSESEYSETETEYIYFTSTGKSVDATIILDNIRGKTMSVIVKKDNGQVTIRKGGVSESSEMEDTFR